MAATIKHNQGMHNFFYLLVFVFLSAELILPGLLFWLLLKGRTFGLKTSTLSQEKDTKKHFAFTQNQTSTSVIQDAIIQMDTTLPDTNGGVYQAVLPSAMSPKLHIFHREHHIRPNLMMLKIDLLR